MGRKILILGTDKNVDFSSQVGKDILYFLQENNPSVCEHISTYYELIKKVKQNQDTIILYCPARIPQKIFRKLNQEIEKTKSILKECRCTIGHLKLKGTKVEQICFSFNKDGYINKKFDPRKKKQKFYRRAR